jgi:hypothetical protein
MKRMKHAVWAVALAVLAGCATTFRPWSLSEVATGMSRAQVIQILGEPDSAETDEEVEILHYTYMENYNPPLTDDSVHANTAGSRRWDRQMERAFREYRYAVKLVDGKVQNYKEVTD